MGAGSIDFPLNFNHEIKSQISLACLAIPIPTAPAQETEQRPLQLQGKDPFFRRFTQK
jgi:hypothetical protein